MPYAELHCISNYSFLRGASHPEELIMQAANLGYEAIAITDECTMAGIVKAHVAAKEYGIKLIIGSEFNLDEDLRLVFLAPNRIGYGQICNLITMARRRAEKGKYSLALKDLEFATDQCIVIWLPEEPRAHHEQHKHGAYTPAALLFLLAFVFDALDAVGHAAVVLALLAAELLDHHTRHVDRVNHSIIHHGP